MKVIPERNEYLSTIFKLNESNKKITNKVLSQELGVSPPSVTEMLKKLREIGMLEDQKDIALSKKGEDYAKEIVSKHRLWEYFLTESLDYNWEDVHNQAQLLQNVTSDKMFESLNEYLNYPKTCPHGGIIYTNHELENGKVSMAEAKVGHRYMVQSIYDDKSLLDYINRLPINIGDQVEILGFDSFDNAAQIEVNGGGEISVSHKATEEIFLVEDNE